jgi:hypothetical protein
MPEMDGYMLMRQVRGWRAEQGGKIPAIADSKRRLGTSDRSSNEFTTKLVVFTTIIFSSLGRGVSTRQLDKN